MYLHREDKKKTVIENYGEEKWGNMLENLRDPRKNYVDLQPYSS